MSISVTGLCEAFIAILAGEWHRILVNTDVISQVAEFRELQWTHLALQYLVHPLRIRIVLVYDVVSILVNHVVAAAVAQVILLN